MPIAICPVPDGIMLAPILERISRPNRPVCDRLHGAPTAKMLAVFSQCKRSFMTHRCQSAADFAVMHNVLHDVLV
jgi:hypothetical protein